jgi:prepilin-type N-terminal cleavage/methylation domain-containing protein
MDRPLAHRGFTLVELLVALIMMGVAAAGLVSALTGDRWLRDAAAAHAYAADRARERLEQLAALPCTPSASGANASVWGSERWRASSSQLAWYLTDSVVMVRQAAAPVVIVARVACPE